jgi:glyoxylase-like metal-dependent hydrolase (beta-lactamase superfamily II)
MPDYSTPQRIEFPMNFTFKSVNAYLYLEPEPVLVDCGILTDIARTTLEQALAAHGLTFTDIRRVFITHPHIDHIGLAAELAQAGAEIWVSDIAADTASTMQSGGPQHSQLLAGLLKRFGIPQPALESIIGLTDMLAALRQDVPKSSLHRFELDGQLEFGGQCWDVVYAPGHSNRQVCFYATESGDCFSADMLLPKAPVPVIESQLDDPQARSLGLPQMLRSYDRFAELAISQVYPGHGEPFTEHVQLIRNQQNRIQKRKEQCFELVRSGLNRFWDLNEEMYSYLPPEGRMGGLGMLLGYLDLLEAEERIVYQCGAEGETIVPA